LERQALGDKRGTEQIGEADASRACAEKQVLFILQLCAFEFGRIDHPRKGDTCCALHIVVIDAVLIAIALEQVHSVRTCPILKVDAAFRKYLLHRLDELVDKGVERLSRRTCLAHAEVQGIVQVLFVIGTGIEIHGQQVLRRYSSAGRVQLQLSDGDPHPIRSQIAESEDPASIRDADEANIFLRLVLQDFLDLATPCHREKHTARLTIDVPELQTCLTDGRVIHDWEKASRVGHDSPIKERFVVVEQIDQVDVAIEVRGLVAELHHHPA
jgi:hypothetical protein